MKCETCGRPAENGTATHWLGCEAARVVTLAPTEITSGGIDPMFRCEHNGCSEPKWSDGPRTKFCTTHKDPKSREK